MNKGLLHIHIAVFLFGFAGLFAKFLSTGPLVIVLGRTFFAAVTLFLYVRITGRVQLKVPAGPDLFRLMIQGVLLAVHWYAFFEAIRISSVAVGLVTFSTFPLFVTFLEPAWFKERLFPSDVILAVILFAGILLVIPEYNFSNQTTLGGCYGIFSGFTFALLALVNRQNAKTRDPVTIAFYQNLFAALCLIIPVFLSAAGLPEMSDMAGLMVLGVFCTALSHTLFIRALTRIKAQTVSIITGLEPVYGIILAFILLGEVPAARTLAGGIIIIGSTIAAGVKKQASVSG